MFYLGEYYDVNQAIHDIQDSLGKDHKHDVTFCRVVGQLRYRYNLAPFLLVFACYLFYIFSGGSSTSTLVCHLKGGQRVQQSVFWLYAGGSD